MKNLFYILFFILSIQDVIFAQTNLIINNTTQVSIMEKSKIKVNGDLIYNSEKPLDPPNYVDQPLTIAVDAQLVVTGDLEIAGSDFMLFIPLLDGSRSTIAGSVIDINNVPRGITFTGENDSRIIGSPFLHSIKVSKTNNAKVIVEGNNHPTVAFDLVFQKGNMELNAISEDGAVYYPSVDLSDYHFVPFEKREERFGKIHNESSNSKLTGIEQAKINSYRKVMEGVDENFGNLGLSLKQTTVLGGAIEMGWTTVSRYFNLEDAGNGSIHKNFVIKAEDLDEIAEPAEIEISEVTFSYLDNEASELSPLVKNEDYDLWATRNQRVTWRRKEATSNSDNYFLNYNYDENEHEAILKLDKNNTNIFTAGVKDCEQELDLFVDNMIVGACEGGKATLTLNPDQSNINYEFFWEEKKEGNYAKIIGASNYAYTEAEVGQYRLIATNAQGCMDTVCFTVVEKNPPKITKSDLTEGIEITAETPYVTVPPFTFITGQEIKLSAFIADQNSDDDGVTMYPLRYVWKIDDEEGEEILASEDTEIDHILSFVSGGSKIIDLTVINNVGCSTTFSEEIVIVEPPNVSFDSYQREVCVGEELTLTVNVTEEGNGYNVDSYKWEWQDVEEGALWEAIPDADIVQNLQLTFPVAGIKNIRVIGRKSIGENSYLYTVTSNAVTVTIHPTVEDLEIIADKGASCVDETVTFTPSLNYDGESSQLMYKWTLWDGTLLETTSITPTFPTHGEYEIVLEVTSNGNCIAEQRITYIVFPEIPTLAITPKELQTYCVGDEFPLFNRHPLPDLKPFDATYAYQWYVDGEEIGTSQQEEYTLATEGNRDIELVLTVLKEGVEYCSTVTKETIIVNSGGTADFNATVSGILCVGEEGTFTSSINSTTHTFHWLVNGEEQQVSASTSFNYKFDASGTYNIALYFSTIEGCNSTTSTQQFTVETPIILPTLQEEIKVCEGEYELILEDLGEVAIPENSTFSWYKMPFISDEIANTQDITVTTSGIYQLVVTSENGCSKTNQYTINLTPPLEVDLGPDRIIFNPVTLSSNVVAESYKWYRNNQYISNQKEIIINTSGSYVLEVTTNHCSFKGTIEIIKENGIPISLPSVFYRCADAVTLIPEVVDIAAFTYAWNTGETTPSIVVTETGSYTLVAEHIASGVTFTMSTEVEATPTIVPQIELVYTCVDNDVTIINSTETTLPLLFELWINDAWVSVENWYKMSLPIGIHTIKYRLKNAYDCLSEGEQTIIISECPQIALSIEEGCINTATTFDLEQSNAEDYTIVNYLWDFGDGQFSSIAAPIHVYTQEGTYAISLQLQVEIGSKTIQIDKSAVVSVQKEYTPLWQDDLSVCADEYLLSAPEGAEVYRWKYLDDNTWIENATKDLLVQKSGRYLVEIEAGNCLYSKTITVSLNSSLDPDLGEDQIVCGTTILSAGYDGYDYLWSTGETTKDITVVTSGTYAVTVTDPINNCSATSEDVHIEVLSIPTVDLGDDQSMCIGSTVTLDAGTNADYYLWNTGETTPTITVNTTGIYSVEVGRTGITSCKAIDYVHVTIEELPVPFFSAPSICLGEAVTFNNSSDPSLNMYWDFGDGETSTDYSPLHHYSTSGEFTVTLQTISALGCQTSFSQEIEVTALPVTAFSSSLHCQTFEVDFINASQGTGQLTYYWDFGDGSSSTAQSPSHTYASAGNYSVSLTTYLNGKCQGNIAVQEVEVYPILTDLLESNITACGTQYTFDLGETDYLLQWDNGSTLPKRTVTASGTYTLKITHPIFGCSHEQTIEVILNALPETTLPSSISACDAVVLATGVENASYYWSTGENSAAITVRESGTYSVRIVNVEGCETTHEVEVDVYSFPIIDLPLTYEACKGEEVVLSSGTVGRHLWSTGNTTSSLVVTSNGNYSLSVTNENSCTSTASVYVSFVDLPVLHLPAKISNCGAVVLDPQYYQGSLLWSTGETTNFITVTTSGTYTVIATSPSGCIVSNTVEVDIYDIPTLDLGEDQYLCFGESTVLDAGEGVSYYWSNGATTRTLEVSATGTYWVVVQTANGCDIRDEIQITLGDDLSPNLGADQLLCNDGNYIETTVGSLEGRTFEWFNTQGSLGGSTYLNVNEAGKYWLKIFNEQGCSATDTITMIETDKVMVANFLMSTVVNIGEAVHFVQVAYDDPTTFSWDFGDGSTSTTESPINRYFTAGDYHVTLYVSNGVCDDQITKVITVQDPSDNNRVVDNNSPSDSKPGSLAQLLTFETVRTYPNPTEAFTTLDFTLSNEGRVEWTLINMNGVQLQSKTIIAKEAQQLIDMSTYPTGVYFLHVMAGQSFKTLKVIKK